MKMCQSHWDELREGLEARGLSKMVAPNGAAAITRLKRELDGTAGPDDFDPLMAAHNMIISNALSLAGPWVFTIEGCPICTLNGMHATDCREPGCTEVNPLNAWIGYALDGVEQAAKQFLLGESK